MTVPGFHIFALVLAFASLICGVASIVLGWSALANRIPPAPLDFSRKIPLDTLANSAGFNPRGRRFRLWSFLTFLAAMVLGCAAVFC